MKHGLIGLVLMLGLASAALQAEMRVGVESAKIPNLYQQVPELGPPTWTPQVPARKPLPRWIVLPWGFRYAL